MLNLKVFLRRWGDSSFIRPLLMVLTLTGFSAAATAAFETDTIKTVSGALKITFIGHGTLMFEYQDKIIHVDPVSRSADYSKMPKADLILITHEHGDHLDNKATAKIKKEATEIVLNQNSYEKINEGIVMKNGDTKIVQGFKIEAVPAYNLVHMRSPNVPYHPKGNGNGYVIAFGDKRVYVAGDTENIPEMKKLRDIDIAFLPMNLPYTMTPKMAADAAQSFKPGILYPYHFGDTDVNQLVSLLKGNEEIEVRIRKLK